MLTMPAECKETKSLVKTEGYYWSLLCVDSNNKEIFYHAHHSGGKWERYDVVRK